MNGNMKMLHGGRRPLPDTLRHLMMVRAMLDKLKELGQEDMIVRMQRTDGYTDIIVTREKLLKGIIE